MEISYASAHYDFHFLSGSIAERDILKIAETQENCYGHITSFLGFEPDFRLQYHLFDTPEDVGKAYAALFDDEDDSPCNGFTCKPCDIYAVYNDDVKCIGMHEDTHIISYYKGCPSYNFIKEGLAMYMDREWWGKPNEHWALAHTEKGFRPSMMLENEQFFSFPEEITYPLSGAYTAFLISAIGAESFLRDIYYNKSSLKDSIEAALRMTVSEADIAFEKHLKNSSV